MSIVIPFLGYADSNEEVLLRKADRYAQEGTYQESQESLAQAYHALYAACPTDTRLISLKERLDRYQALPSINQPATELDLAYFAIEKKWQEGSFWQAKRELTLLTDRLLNQLDSSGETRALTAQCFYLQGEMESMQGSLLAAYRAYTKALCFSESACAPWYTRVLVKSLYCLIGMQAKCAPLSWRLEEIDRLMAHPMLSPDSRCSFEEAARLLRERPCVDEKIQAWMHQSAGKFGSFLSMPKSYSKQQRALENPETLDEGLYLADHFCQLICRALKNGEVDQARKWNLLLEERCPGSPKCPQGYFYLARDAEEKRDLVEACRLYQECFQRFKESPFAAESAFFSYPYQEYIEGKKEALQHLNLLEERYPYSYYALLSRYVRALGQMQTDPLTALALHQALQESGEISLQLEQKGQKERDEIAMLMLRALYAQASCYRLIAEKATGAKRNLFLAYSQTAYRKVIEKLSNLPDHCPLLRGACYESLLKCAELAGDEHVVQRLCQGLFDQFDEKESCYQGLLARGYYALGASHARLQEDKRALTALKKALDLAGQTALSSVERSHLFFLQSQLYRRAGDLDAALKSLSCIINDPSLSKERFKALYERAEIFCQQGRMAHANKQWEALLRADEEWPAKAKQRLEEYRVY